MKKTTTAVIVVCLLYMNILGALANAEVVIHEENVINNTVAITTTGTASWTYMVYFNGDHYKPHKPWHQDEANDIIWMLPGINRMELSGSTPEVNIVVQADDYAVWGGETRRYYIVHDEDLYNINSPLADTDTSEKNMGDPQTLINFVNWATSAYPAQHYALVMFDHGAGWIGYSYDASSGYDIEDENHMDVIELENAFSSCPHLDILFLWGCDMGMIEVTYQLKDYVDIILASEPSMSYCNDTFEQPLKNLTTCPQLTPASLANMIANSYSFTVENEENVPPEYQELIDAKTLFGVYTDHVDDITDATDSFANALMNPVLPGPVMGAVENAFDDSEYVFSFVHDLYEFAESISEGVDPVLEAHIVQTAEQVLLSFDDAIIAPTGSPDKLHGLSIYSPGKIFFYIEDIFSIPGSCSYDETSFGEDTKWDEFLKQYYKQSLSHPAPCFLAGTQISMADESYKNIEDIEVGDIIKSYDLESGKMEAAEVTKVYHHEPEAMADYYLIINDKLCVTPNHLLYINGELVLAGDAKIGDTFTSSVSEPTITSVDQVFNQVPTYNFELESSTQMYYVEDIPAYPLKPGNSQEALLVYLQNSNNPISQSSSSQQSQNNV